MDKARLLAEILAALNSAQRQALNAADQAHETATHTENKAENKYDTLGLEAAYLAHGQSQRVLDCAADIKAFEGLSSAAWPADAPVNLGALICLGTHDGGLRWVFLGPRAGGLTLQLDAIEIVVVTPASPLGQQLLGRYVDDEVSISLAGRQEDYVITNVY